MYVTEGDSETRLIFNEGQDVPDMSVYLLNTSEAGRAEMREYYRAYIPTGFLFGLGVNASMMSHAELGNAPTLDTGIST